MAEEETGSGESREQPPQKPTLVEEVRAEAQKKQRMWQNAQGKTEKDPEVAKNITENAQNFWKFFEKIPAERYSSLDTPEKLIEALNEAGGNFLKKGEKISVNGVCYRIFEIHPMGPIDEILSICNKKGYVLMSGTNFWDNPPEVGRLFIPVIYLAKREI